MSILPKKPFPFTLHKSILFSLLISLIYWIYLIFTTSMGNGGDAICYELLGTDIHENGWIEFFKTGPHREPIYLFLISFSMKISSLLSIPYQLVQKIFQIIILFISQILLLKVLKKLKINPYICAATILYFGFSPAIINSALSLYSEIATYPIIHLIILLNVKAWEELPLLKETQSIRLGIYLGITFTLITFIKGIFELITPIFIIPYLILAFITFKNNQKLLSKRILMFILSFIIIFYGSLNFYKLINKTYNGQFVFTNRGAWALYGNTTRRMQKLNGNRILTALAYVPGEGVCHSLFSKEECLFWSFQQSDSYGMTMHQDLVDSKMPADKIDKILIDLSKKQILNNPLQYIFFMGLESLKLLFWESTKIGFVYYPEWLTVLYDNTLFKNTLRLLLTITTMFSLLAIITYTWKQRLKIFNLDKSFFNTHLLFFIILLISAYIGLHSFFFVITRYAFPIVPLYLIAIAFTTDIIFTKRHP